MATSTIPLNVTEAIEEALVSDDLDTVAVLYAQAIARRDAWRNAASEIEKHLALVMEGHGVKRYELAGTGMLEVSRSAKRTKWRHDDLLGDIARQVPAHRPVLADGDIEPAEWTMARLVAKCLSLGAGKITGLKDLGLTVDEYCEVAPSEAAVRFVRFDSSSVEVDT